MTDLAQLIGRLEAASEGSRELDYAMWAALQGVTMTLLQLHGGFEATGYAGKLSDPDWLGAPRLTTSLDAIVALAKRHGFYINSEPRFHIEVEGVIFRSHALRPLWSDWRPDDEWFDRGEARHPDQAISACIAFLRALQAQQETS